MKKLMKLFVSTLLITMIVFNLGACSKKTPAKDTYETGQQVSKETSNDKSEDTKKEDVKQENQTNEDNKETAKEETHYPVVVIDRYGEEIKIEKEPETIISISPEMTETIFALGVGDKLIGRTDYCDFPSEVKDIESIGTLYEVNFEKIVELEPDIVFASSHAKDETIKQLQDQGIKVLALSWNEDFEGVYSYMTTIGNVVDKTDEVNELVNKMKETVTQLTKAVEGLEQPNAYFITGYGEWGDYTATGDTFLGQIIEMAGATNAAADGTNWSYSIEQLVDKDPDILICSSLYDSKKQIEALEGYKDLTAVKEGRFFEVDENLFFRQGPRLIDGLATLIDIFHPEVLDMDTGK